MGRVLRFATKKPLDANALVFDAHGEAAVLGQGGRYGGEWAITIVPMTPNLKPVEGYPVIGSAQTDAGDSLDGYATMQAWVQEQARAAGLSVVSAQDRNGARPVEERQYFLAGLFVLARD